MLAIFVDFAFGVAMGALGGFFGIGGGLIAIPVMTIIFEQSQTLAQGTALVMMVPNLVLAFWRYQQRTPLNWPLVLPLAGAGFICAGVGARLATKMDAQVIQFGFVILMIFLAMLNLVRARLAAISKSLTHPTSSRLAVLGTGCGSRDASWFSVLMIGRGLHVNFLKRPLLEVTAQGIEAVASAVNLR